MKELKLKFGERYRDDKAERLIYSHDVASLPDVVEKMVIKLPQAVVQPVNVEEVVFVVNYARQHNIPIVPRGAGTSGYGGVLPVKGGIVVNTSRMRRIINVDKENMTVTVEPGVVWGQLEEYLNERGLALRLYPTSTPSATVAGWIAEGGTGIGSYEYGYIGQHVVAVKIVTPDGQVKVMTGSELDLVNRAEGITGIIVEATIKVRPKEEHLMHLAAFKNLVDLQKTLAQIKEAGLPLWHVGFVTREFVKNKLLAKNKDAAHADNMALFVYPQSREDRVKEKLLAIIQANGGLLLGDKEAQEEWNERFYPMRLKSLGPSLIPSEAVVPVANLDKILSEAEEKLPGISIEGMMVGDSEATLLCFLKGDERTSAFTIGFAKSLILLEVAQKYGGRLYSVGLYFTDMAEQVLGESTLEKLRRFKRQVDPGSIMNPGKILVENENPALLRGMMKMGRYSTGMLGVAEAFTSNKPKESNKLPGPLASAPYVCAQCGYCTEVCTLHQGFGWESASPKGKWYILKQYLEGKYELDQKMVDMLLMCTTCKKCDPVCQVNLPIMELWDMLRPILIMEKGYSTYPAFEMMGASIESDLNIWAGRKRERANWIPEDVEIKDKAPIGYWAGCTASFVETEIAEQAVRILKEGGVEFTTLGTDEGCCGIPMLVAGKHDTFEIVFRNNVENLRKRGVKELVISCPGCYAAFTHYYPHFAEKLGYGDLGIKFVHISEVVDRLVKEGKLKFKKPINKKLAWHDSCHIGRLAGIYEPPRNVLKAIPGVELVECKKNREHGSCCGSVLTRIGNPKVSNKLAADRLQEVIEAGAEALVATCPCCEVQLRVGGAKSGVNLPVIDFSSVVIEALGYEAKDTTAYMFSLWEVFEKAIDIMTRDGIVKMMGEMMPEIMQAMPNAMKPVLKGMEALPGPIQKPSLSLMEKMVPLMMPVLFPSMMPKLMPKVMELMKKEIPNMPPQMEEKLPDMLPKVMARIMPGMLAEVAPLLAPKMTEYIARKKAN